MLLRQLQDVLALRLDRGERLADVEAELIDAAVALSDDERAALWLFAWSGPTMPANDSTASGCWRGWDDD